MSIEPCRRCGKVKCAEERELRLELLDMEGSENPPLPEVGQPVDPDATRTRLVVGSDQGDSPGFCLRAGHIITAAEYDHGKKLLRVYTEDSAPLRDLLNAAKQWRASVEADQLAETFPSKADQALFDAIDKAEGKT